MAFPGSNYAPPGVYTRTLFENSVQGLVAGLRVPVLIGTGSEILESNDFELVRGSSSSVDQRIVQEDMANRSVVSVSLAGAVTLGAFDGERRRVQVRHYPIVTGQGNGQTATRASAVTATVNGQPTVVTYLDGSNGIVELAFAPTLGDVVQITYFFKRLDTQTTDNLSEQVSEDSAIIYGLNGESFSITTGDNDTVHLTVDGRAVTVTIPDSGTSVWTAAQVATFITAAAGTTSLAASTYVTNYGATALKLVADQDIVVGAGNANSTLGFVAGSSTARNKVFYTFNGPIVDGSNGGVTTTDPALVTVRVNNAQVIPTAVDGANRAVTLPFAPAAGSTVAVSYYFNTWQDTFDYLENIGVLNITRCGISPDRNDYTEGVDFALKDDKIVWGTASLVSSGVHTLGYEYFGTSQVASTLVDTRTYLEPCAAVVDSTISPPVESRTKFNLPLQPTTGNGRGSPLGTSLFQTVSNGRIDLPTTRPDLVFAYWGYSVQDALDRGRVTVVAVDATTVTLKSPVPVGATVYATFYYNTLQDQTYTLTTVAPGASGVGSYTVQNSAGDFYMTPQFGLKSSGLAAVTVNFPSGSERKPDVRFEVPFVTTDYSGPVEEDVTVTFAATDSTVAMYTFPGAGDYATVDLGSDRLRLLIDGAALAGGASGIDLTGPIAGVSALGFPATYVGSEVIYSAESGHTTYDIDSTNNTINLMVDGVFVAATATAATGATVSDYVDAINVAADAVGPVYTAAGRFLSPFTVDSNEYDKLSFSYTGDVSGLSGTLVATLAAATYANTPALAAQLQTQMASAVATLVGSDPAFTGLAVSVGADSSGRMVFGLTRPSGTTASGTMTVSGVPDVGDTVRINTTTLTGVSGVPGALQFQVDGGTNELVAQSIIDGFTAAGIVDGIVEASTNGAGVITFTATELGADGNAITIAAPINVGAALAVSGATLEDGNDPDSSGFLEFITNGTPAHDFAVVAGVDAASSAGGAQVKLFSGPVATRYTVTGDNTGALDHDRIILRSRLVPGFGTVHPASLLTPSIGIEVLGGTGAANVGLTPATSRQAAWRGSITPATMAGVVGWSGGQYAGSVANAAGQPIVTFYAAGGTQTPNTVLKFTMDGVPVTLVFTDDSGSAIASGGSADVPVGPGASSYTVIAQIRAAMTAAGLSSASSRCVQEGAGFRLISLLDTEASSIVVGAGSANDVLGLTAGDVATRTLPSAGVLASALMAHSAASVATSLLAWDSPTSTYFAAEALAFATTNTVGATFLSIQSRATPSLGSGSSVALVAASSADALRQGTFLGGLAGDGATGEAGTSGFYVTSSDPENGSGTANISVLNDGVGQDGLVGQTYRDRVTGLTFTVLPRTGGSLYPSGSRFTFTVRQTATTDSNLPTNAIPGVELVVTNTLSVAAGDTALVETLARGGEEPAVGDVYYVSYQYGKQDFQTQIYTRFNAIEAAFGVLSTDNPVTLAAYLAILNGAVLIGVKQVQKDEENGTRASVTAYRNALDELEGALPGGTLPSILVPLRGDSLPLFQYAARHADIQSDIRHRAERTVVAGFASGTSPATARQWAPQVGRTRFRLVYPDVMLVPLPQSGGQADEQAVVDGSYLAAMLVGSLVQPSTDVATPWTGRLLTGATRLARTLDAVQQNQVAVAGVTIVEDRNQVLRVREGFTTDMSELLTKIPTIIQIVDETQQQSRATLERFVGIKFIPGILSQIEGQLSTTLRGLVEAQILASYQGVRAQVSSTDFTTAEVSATVSPVFPLLYIVCSFTLTARGSAQ